MYLLAPYLPHDPCPSLLLTSFRQPLSSHLPVHLPPVHHHPPPTPPLHQIFRSPARLFHHTHPLFHFLAALDIPHYDAFLPPFLTIPLPLRSYHHTNTTLLCHRSYPKYLMSPSFILPHAPQIVSPSSHLSQTTVHSIFLLQSPILFHIISPPVQHSNSNFPSIQHPNFIHQTLQRPLHTYL